jgi:hypothetical protein
MKLHYMCRPVRSQPKSDGGTGLWQEGMHGGIIIIGIQVYGQLRAVSDAVGTDD